MKGSQRLKPRIWGIFTARLEAVPFHVGLNSRSRAFPGDRSVVSDCSTATAEEVADIKKVARALMAKALGVAAGG